MEWVKRFGGEEIQYEEEMVKPKTEEVDDIKIEKVQKAIEKLKERKACGPDGIQNEAWVYEKEEVKEQLRIILN